MASYTDEMSRKLYRMVRDRLIAHLRYPSGLAGCEYDPEFAVRGLHYGIPLFCSLRARAAQLQLHAGLARVQILRRAGF